MNIFPENHPAYIDSIARDGVPANAVSIYKGRNEVFSLDAPDGTVVNIKAFHTPRFPNSYIYTNLRQSKARRSYQNASRLIALGFSTPRPLAYVEEKRGGALRRSYYISEQVPFRTIRDWTTIPDCRQLVDDLGAEMHRMMCKGVYHRDFSPGNLLYEQLPDGHFRFYFVDLNRMEFGVTSQSKLMRMFRAITFDPEELRDLAAAYARAAGKPVESAVQEAFRQHRRYLDEKARLKKLKKIFK